MNYEIFETKERAMADNARAAKETRAHLRARGVKLVNLMGSPGAGKTSVLMRLIDALSPLRVGVMEADVDSYVDARTVAERAERVIQLHTGGLCHMDADMTRRGLERMGVEGLDVVFLENIGNLVCPAEFDTGADVKLTVFSVPEGDDKPLKYPLMFKVCDCLAINKIDTLPVFDFDMAALTARVRALNPDIAVFPVSAETGEGIDALAKWLIARLGGDGA